jgi:hypothetical protein
MTTMQKERTLDSYSESDCEQSHYVLGFGIFYQVALMTKVKIVNIDITQ